MKKKKVVYEKTYTSNSKWGQKIESYVRVERCFSFKDGVWYWVTVPNFGCGKKKMLDAIFVALEYESILAAKYNGLKDRISEKYLWNEVTDAQEDPQ